MENGQRASTFQMTWSQVIKDMLLLIQAGKKGKVKEWKAVLVCHKSSMFSSPSLMNSL